MTDVAFTEDGDLTPEIPYRLDRILVGELAIAYLAEQFADQTHGNYRPKTLYDRADLGDRLEVVVFPATRESKPWTERLVEFSSERDAKLAMQLFRSVVEADRSANGPGSTDDERKALRQLVEAIPYLTPSATGLSHAMGLILRTAYKVAQMPVAVAALEIAKYKPGAIPLRERQSLAETWESFEKEVLPHHDAESRLSYRRVFYAGALAFNNLVFQNLDGGQDPTELDIEYMKSLDEELEQFRDSLG